MDRRSFLGSAMAAALAPEFRAGAQSDAVRPRSAGDIHEKVFPYRAWAFCVYSYDWELLENYVKAALPSARAYGINTFELHDYNMGSRGIVDACVQYKYFSKLAGKPELTYRRERCPAAQKEADYQRFRTLVRSIKDQGVKVNIWYHVLRDAPAELFTEYPEIKDLDSGFIWTYFDGLFREFFERMPEVDRVTITSLHETPSIMSTSGTLSREDRLLKLYLALYQCCRKAGKELIIRDFIAKAEDFASFWQVLNRLPPDIYIMTKEILADWIHTDMAPNPFLRHYVGRKVVVEFDLYGEYWGRLDLPACYPEYLYRQIRTIKGFDVQGAVGRVIHEDQRSTNFQTIFESPNEVNCYAFSQYLSKPFPWLGPGCFTDPQTQPGHWGWDLDAFDAGIWLDWAGRRYGQEAAFPVVRAFQRTKQTMSLTFDIAGRGFQEHSHLPSLRTTSFLWEPFVERVERVGMDYLREEKRQAARLTRSSLEDIRSAQGSLKKTDYDQLVGLFEGALLIIRSYQTLLEGYYQIYLAQRQRNQDGLKNAGDQLRKLGQEIASARGEAFFGRLPGTLAELAGFVEAGQAPKPFPRY